MQNCVLKFTDGKWRLKKSSLISEPDLILAFLSPNLPDMSQTYETLRRAFPGVNIVGCSTAGEISGSDVYNDSAVAVALKFEKTTLKIAHRSNVEHKDSFKYGQGLAQDLSDDKLQGILILSEGLQINGTQLVAGVRSVIDKGCTICGGLAGDNSDFATTFVGVNGPLESRQIAAIGFYGDSFSMHSGAGTGWDTFGPIREVTKSDEHKLYELNNQSALALYKRYLGDDVKGLPGSALLYPLMIHPPDAPENCIIRTVIGIDEEDDCLLYAGDIPEGYTARLMVGNFDRLIDGAAKATQNLPQINPENSLAILISCVGRHLVLGQRAYEETSEVQKNIKGTPQIGFYSYGEISPQLPTGACALHNQTMTVAILEEHV